MKSAFLCSVVVCLYIASVSGADTFGTGANQFDIEFVTIGDPGNASDNTGHGAVDYSYRIGKYEITQQQWDKVAAVTGVSGGGAWSGQQPVADVSWYHAAFFCNFLTSGSIYNGVYQFTDSGNFDCIDRQTARNTYGAIYFLPTEDEWYKAAYYDASNRVYYDFSNTSDTPPIEGDESNYNYGAGTDPWQVGSGMLEMNGTYDMMGNVWEWTETKVGNYRSKRGGYYASRDSEQLSSSYYTWGSEWSDNIGTGFRIASVPEPASLALLALGGLTLRKRK